MDHNRAPTLDVALQPGERGRQDVTADGVLTLGVEEEFLLVDQHGRFGAVGPEVSEALDPPAGEVEHELRRCQIESATNVCDTVDDVVGGLRELRNRLAAEAGEHGLRLLPSATALLTDDLPPRFTPDARFERMGREFGALARASLTCACHVHVAIPDRAGGLAVSNHVRPWLPVLLALMANSPFHGDADTQYASWRYEMWTRWPSAGPPPHFHSADDYESRVDGLMRAGAILDRGMIYWDIRLSEQQPTVEVRIADVAGTPEEAALLAVLIRALAGQALDGTGAAAGVDLSQEVLRARLWQAARDGLSGQCVDPRTGQPAPTWHLVEALVQDVRPWLRSTGDEAYVMEALATLRATGGGADRQRAVFARRRRLTDVIDSLVWPTVGTSNG